jgi:hypothetical protein
MLDHFYSKMRTGQTGGKINYYLSLKDSIDLVVMGQFACIKSNYS